MNISADSTDGQDQAILIKLGIILEKNCPPIAGLKRGRPYDGDRGKVCLATTTQDLQARRAECAQLLSGSGFERSDFLNLLDHVAGYADGSGRN